MASNETVDIRRAFDRLQSSFEAFADRHRDMRRERKQLREQIAELEELAAQREAMFVEQADQMARIRTELSSQPDGKETDLLHKQIGTLKGDLDDLSGKQLQTIAKLDAATRAEAMARMETASVRNELEQAGTALAELSKDLGEALDMAANNERELLSATTSLEEMRHRAITLESELEMLRSTQPLHTNGNLFAEEERLDVTRKIDEAIALIDLHLGQT